MKKFCEQKWQQYGKFECIMLKSRVFIFHCDSEEMKTCILNQSLWPFASKMLFIKPWTQDIDLCKEDMDSVPIWIRFPALKLYYYTGKGLIKFTSYVGRPLYTDGMTAKQERLFFARVSMKVKMDHKLPDFIPYVNEFGTLEHQKMDYEWLPPWCKGCCRFGHLEKFCPKKFVTKIIWVPKKKVDSNEPTLEVESVLPMLKTLKVSMEILLNLVLCSGMKKNKT